MIAIYCVSTRDEALALENVKWWNELGGCPGHECLYLYDPRVTPERVGQIQAELHRCFTQIYAKRVDGEIDGWPEGANYFFRLSNAMVEQRPYKYFLWLEPDAAPLKEGWMDALEKEYLAGQKPFMGGRVQGVYNGQEVPLHMTGIAIYPSPLYNFAGEAYRAHDVAWDIAGKDQIIPLAHFTNLFCHAWQHPGFKSIEELVVIPDSAVMFHGVKDLSLISLLRQKRGGKQVGTLSIQEPRSEPERHPGSPSSLLSQQQDRGGNTIQEKEPVPINTTGSPAPPFALANGGDAFYAHTKPQRFGDVPPPGIHQVTPDIWVIENDMISAIINQQKKLDADELIPKILPYIQKGDTVIDAGAFVGDHAIAYSEAVGEEGSVICFEPSPLPFLCLKHNLAKRSNVSSFQMALGENGSAGNVYMVVEANHYGGAYIGKSYDKPMYPVDMITLDSTGLKPNVIKLDLEGYEVKALEGAEETIRKYQPKLIIEVNEEALKRQEDEPKNIFWLLNDWGYEWQILLQNTPSLYDIVALPVKANDRDNRSAVFPTTEAPLPASTLDSAISILREHAQKGKEQRKYVLRLLRENELYPKTPHKATSKGV